MRTKTLLLTAALTAAGIATSMAQVYSVNIVGYINLNLNPGLSLIANQLNASPNNSVQVLFGSPPNPMTINKFVAASGTYAQAIFDPDAGWNDPTSMVLNPGEGAFIDNAGAAFTLTLVGEVKLNSSLSIHQGLDVYSSVIPQQAPLDAMNFPIPAGSITVFRFNGSGYDPSIYDPDAGAWNPSAPSPRIGEAFFIDNASGASFAWGRTFPVGP